jgi:hypothetical protein
MWIACVLSWQPMAMTECAPRSPPASRTGDRRRVHRPLLGGLVTTPPIAEDIVQVIPRRDGRFPGHPGGSIATGAQRALGPAVGNSEYGARRYPLTTGAMMVSDQELDALLKRLHFSNTRLALRQQTRLERVARRARCPYLKNDCRLRLINRRSDFRSSAPRCRPTSRQRAVSNLQRQTGPGQNASPDCNRLRRHPARVRCAMDMVN